MIRLGMPWTSRNPKEESGQVSAAFPARKKAVSIKEICIMEMLSIILMVVGLACSILVPQFVWLVLIGILLGAFVSIFCQEA